MPKFLSVTFDPGQSNYKGIDLIGHYKYDNQGIPVDGRPDELVHGVNLIGTPLVMFSEIIAAGDETGVFNGICGAESGGVPVAALSPALLVKKIETQNQFAIDIDEPILQAPTEK